MLNLARTVVEFTAKLASSLGAVGSIARWDLDDLASELRAICLEAEARGEEELATRVERIENALRDLGAILQTEKNYSARITTEFEDALEYQGVPIGRAAELEAAVDHVGLLFDLLSDNSIADAVEGWEELEAGWDNVLEALMDFQIRLVLQDDKDYERTEAETKIISTPYDWEPEGDFEPEQNGLDVISYDSFVEEWVGENGDPNDVIDRIAARTMQLKDAIDALSMEIPFSVGEDIEQALSQTYTVTEELEELLLG